MSGSNDWWDAASRQNPRETALRSAPQAVDAANSSISTGPAMPASIAENHDSDRGDNLLAGLLRNSAAVARPRGSKLDDPFESPVTKTTSVPHSLAGNHMRRPLAGAECAHPVSQIVLREVVETAIGLKRSKDPVERETARDTLLRWLRTGTADPVELLQTVVAGPALADAQLNMRVLSFLHCIVVQGGPSALAAACETQVQHRPSIGARVCLDVLKACTQKPVPSSALDIMDDHIVSWEIDRSTDKSAENSSSLRISAVEMYAVLLSRKLEFHSSYPEIEGNYSLDRYYRQFHVENNTDLQQRTNNFHRRSEVISPRTARNCALLAKGAAFVAAALDRVKAPIDIVGLVFSEVSNAYALARYLEYKLGNSPMKSGPECVWLNYARDWLARRLKAMLSRGGDGLRVVQRYTEPSVIHSIEYPDERPIRPESRHRREIPCIFSTFEGMHGALARSTCL